MLRVARRAVFHRGARPFSTSDTPQAYITVDQAKTKWVRVPTSEGKIYYWHPPTGRTQWHHPDQAEDVDKYVVSEPKQSLASKIGINVSRSTVENILRRTIMSAAALIVFSIGGGLTILGRLGQDKSEWRVRDYV